MQAFQDGDMRIQRNLILPDHYKRGGFYHVYLKRYFDTFGEKQLRVYLYEDFVSSPTAVMQDIFRCLGVDDTFVPDISVKYNRSVAFRNPTSRGLWQFGVKRPNPIKRVIRRLTPKKARDYILKNIISRSIFMTVPPLQVEQRARLVNTYREDILNLEGLINRDLSKWLC
jgi:hypothetical protein